MPTDSNHHSRNLTIYSFFFMLYWLLGLEPTDDNIRLTFVNFSIHNTEVLPYLTHGILFYFAWRFYLNSKKMVKTSFINFFNTFSNLNNREAYPYEKLVKIANHDFKTNHEQKYKDSLKQHLKSNVKDVEVTFNISSFVLNDSNNRLDLIVRGQYQTPRDNYISLPTQNYHIVSYVLKIKKRIYSHLIIWRFIKFSFLTEASPNFFLPWILFLLAITTSILRYFCIDFV